MFRSGNRPRHASLLEPPLQYQGRRGLSPSRVEYPHSSTSNGPLHSQLQPEVGYSSRLVADNDDRWGRPVSPGADRGLFVNKVGRTVSGDYASEARSADRHDGEYEQGYGDSKNDYGKRERSAW